MKKLLLIVGLVFCMWKLSHAITIVPGSSFPIVTTPSNYLRFLLVDTNGTSSSDPNTKSNATIRYDSLVSSISNAILSTNVSFPVPQWITIGLTNQWYLNTNTAFLSPTGNDTTAALGNPLLPSLTLTNAYALSPINGGCIWLLGDVTGQGIVLNKNLTFVALNHKLLMPNVTSAISCNSNLIWWGGEADTIFSPNAVPGPINVELHYVNLFYPGATNVDCIYGIGSVLVDHVIANGCFDAITPNGGSLSVVGNDFISIMNATPFPINPARGISIVGFSGTHYISLKNSALIAFGSTNYNVGLMVTRASTVNLDNVLLFSGTNTVSTNLIVTGASTFINLRRMVTPVSTLTDGLATITNLNDNQFLGSFGGNGSGLTNLIHSSTVSAAAGATVTPTQNVDGSTNYAVGAVGSSGIIFPPNAKGLLANDGIGNTNWYSFTNIIVLTNNPTFTVGQMLVITGTNANGSLTVKGTNIPPAGSGGGAVLPPNALGLLSNDGAGNTNWYAFTNLVIWTNQPTFTVGQYLQITGTNANGSLVVSAVTLPSQTNFVGLTNQNLAAIGQWLFLAGTNAQGVWQATPTNAPSGSVPNGFVTNNGLGMVIVPNPFIVTNSIEGDSVRATAQLDNVWGATPVALLLVGKSNGTVNVISGITANWLHVANPHGGIEMDTDSIFVSSNSTTKTATFMDTNNVWLFTSNNVPGVKIDPAGVITILNGSISVIPTNAAPVYTSNGLTAALPFGLTNTLAGRCQYLVGYYKIDAVAGTPVLTVSNELDGYKYPPISIGASANVTPETNWFVTPLLSTNTVLRIRDESTGSGASVGIISSKMIGL